MSTYNTLVKNISNLNQQNKTTGGYGGGNTALLEMQKAQNQIDNSTHPRTQIEYKDTNGNVIPKDTPTKTPTGTGTGSTTQQTQTPVVDNYDYNSMINDMLGRQREAAQNAYNNSRERLDSAWDATMNSLSANRDSTRNQLSNNYNYSANKVNNDSAKALREAYVNYMLNKRDMGQALSAMGVSGGASESSLANMANSYGNARNNINTTTAENLASLLNTYQNNLASAEQLYNSQYADARNNYMSQLNALENALANNEVSTYSGSSLSNLANYAKTLASLVSAQNTNSQNLAPIENTLGLTNISTTQGAGQTGGVTNFAKYQAMMDNLRANGFNDQDVAQRTLQQMASDGLSQADAFRFFNV